jgi:hypothetical protein
MISKEALSAHLRLGLALVVSIFFLLAIFSCTKNYSDEMMAPKAAIATDLARAVIAFSEKNPTEAASLDDQELVRRATDFDPNLLSPYDGLVVRGTSTGIILVCTGDGKRALIEDAECTTKVDKLLWSNSSSPCQFTLNIYSLCQ